MNVYYERAGILKCFLCEPSTLFNILHNNDDVSSDMGLTLLYDLIFNVSYSYYFIKG